MDWLFSDLYHLIGVVIVVTLAIVALPPVTHFLIRAWSLRFPAKPVHHYSQVGLRQVLNTPALSERIGYMHVQEQGDLTALQHATAISQARALAEQTYASTVDDFILKHAIIDKAAKYGLDAVLSQAHISKSLDEHLAASIKRILTDIDLDKYRTENLTDLEILGKAEKIKDKIARRNEARTRKANPRPKA